MRKRIVLIASALGAIGMMGVGVACSSDETGGNGGGGNQQVQPVTINFTVDASARPGVYASGDLEWKGSMKWNQATGEVTYDSTWTGPFPKLYDDGPKSSGGHEPAGATAGDNKWGAAITTMPPSVTTCNPDAMGDAKNADCNPGVTDPTKFVYTCSADKVCQAPFEYGLIDSTTQGWLWVGSNGSFKLTRASSGKTITAQGITLPAFGTTDLKLVADEAALTAGTDTTTVKVKGSAWGWQEVQLMDDGQNGDDMAGDGKYTFILSNNVGPGTSRTHYGLLASGDQPAFVWVFNGVEYKKDSQADKTGITAYLKTAGGTFEETPVTNATTGNHDTIVTVP